MNLPTGKFSVVSAKSPCQICGRTAGFCKTNEEIHWCSTNTDGRKGEVVDGFAYLGETKDGQWGQWKAHNPNSRKSILSDASFDKLKKAAPNPTKTANSTMPLEERDRHYRAILSGLKLHATDKADLLKRGFTQEQIERSLFKSVGQWQKVDESIPVTLPGMMDNHSLVVQAGYLCPVTNIDGLIVGLQLRLRKPDGNGKYRWVSSKTQKNPDGPTCHIQGENGLELPLAIYQPKHRNRNAIALCEGTGPKPFLASERLQVPTIGAASGNFLGSTMQLKAALERFDPQQKGLVELYPDGGAVSNPSIMQKYQRTLAAIQEWGYTVRVGWWEQVTKEAGDVDEIAVKNIKYISVEDFMGLAQEHGGLQPADSLADAIAEAVTSQVNDQNEVPRGKTFDAHCFEKLFEAGKGKWCVIDSVFYEYTGRGFWERREDEEVQGMIYAYSRIAYRWKQQGRGGEGYEDHCFAADAKAASAFRYCRVSLKAKGYQLKQGEGLLCFKNGTIDIKTGELLPHDKNHYLTWAVNADYTPNAECPEAFREFVISTFGENLLHPIRVITSMLIDPTAPSGYFPHLIGPSGSGKGTLLNLWASMFCEDHVRSGTSFSDLAKPETRHQNLAGARLYLLPDLGGYIQGIRPFYSLVQNESLTGRALYSSSSYQKRWNVKFAVASVSHLKIEDASDGWTRRAFPLPTKTRTCPPDFLLENRLQECKGQIISWAIALSTKIRNRDLERLLVTCKEIANTRNDALLAGDAVRVFIDQCLRPEKGESKTEYRIGNKKLHAMFESFCEKFGYSKMGFLSFVDRIKGVLPEFYDSHTRKYKYEEGYAPAGLFDVVALPGVFHSWTEDESGCLCNKKLCEEGGLEAFRPYQSQAWEDDGDFDLVERTKLATKSADTDPSTTGISAVNGERCEVGEVNSHVSKTEILISSDPPPTPPVSVVGADNEGSGNVGNEETTLATSPNSQPSAEIPATTGSAPATFGSERRFISMATNTPEEVEAYIAAHPCPDGARLALEQGHHIWL